MPRTKYKKQIQNKEEMEANAVSSQYLDQMIEVHKAELKELADGACKQLENIFKEMRFLYKDLLGKTIGELQNSDVPNIESILTGCNTLSRDDGYLSTETSTDSNYTKSRVKFTPSTTFNLASSTLNHSSMRTPATGLITKQQAMQMGFVTPKVKPDRPLTVLRRAQHGEMVISMQGSPILANSMEHERPNVNVPLADGRIISVQPESSIRQSEIPDIDDATRRQLQTLRDNIDKIVSKNNHK